MQSDTHRKESLPGGSCACVVQYQGQIGWHPLGNLQYKVVRSDEYRVAYPLTI